MKGPAFAYELKTYGGSDFERIANERFNTNDLVFGREQYRKALETLLGILKNLPERRNCRTNELAAKNSIDYWMLMRDKSRAMDALRDYIRRFGPGTEFEKWFGGTSDRINAWQAAIQSLPAKTTAPGR